MKSFHDRGLWIRDSFFFLPGSGSGLEKFMDPDSVCPEGLDQFNIRPNPQPWWREAVHLNII